MQRYDTAPLARWISDERRVNARESKEVRRCVLDTLACLAVGWNSEVSRKASRALRKGQQGMIARAVRYGTAMHALDFDDSEIPGSTHPSAVILGALLPLAEQMDATMDDLVRAYIAGFETITWFGRTLGFQHYEAGWHATSTTGLFGAVAACANLLGRTPAQIQNGLSLASSYAGGLQRQFGSEGKAMHVGMAAANALMIVPLISAGYRAGVEVWNGPTGYMALHHAERSNSEFANAALGAKSAFATEGVVRKAYPCCHYTHRLIRAAIKLSGQFDTTDVARIELEMPLGYASVVAAANPVTDHEARFSAAYCVGSALVDGRVGAASFSKRAIKRKAVSTLMAKTEMQPYAVKNLHDLSPDAPDHIRVTLRDGTVLEDEIKLVPGSRDEPLDDRGLVAKGLQCFSAVVDELAAKRLVKLALNDAVQVRELTVGLTRRRSGPVT